MTYDYDVLIVGAGPVGLLGGILAARRGLSTLVVERRDGPQTAPAAHVVNARTFEICRQAGIDVDTLAAAASPVEDSGSVNFVTRLAGDLLGTLPFERQSFDNPTLSPTPLRNLSQHRFEPLLAEELRDRTDAELRYGQQWEAALQGSDGVTSTIVDVATGRTYEIRSRYVVGCDGASSRVRKSLDIEMLGPPLLESFLMIHLEANLRHLVADRPGVLHFVLDPDASGVFVAHDIDADWVYMRPYDDETETVEDYNPDRCRTLVLNAIGCDADIAIAGVSTWRMSAQIADDMRRGRLFLAGDAAHRFPPTGGLGLNTGAQDIHALVWRLGAVIDGWGDDSLLDTYAAERLPVAHHNAEQSMHNAIKMLSVAQAYGTDAIGAAIAEQAEHFDMIGMQLGYVYETGTLVADDEPFARSPVRTYQPTGRPGARLPHFVTVDGGSTLDLVDRARLTLLTFGDHEAWATGVPVNAPVRQRRVCVDPAWAAQCGVQSTGALLVRPDQHVAWRAVDSTDVTTLAGALAEIGIQSYS